MKAKSSPFLSRRTLVQGSAWAVPLVTASATIPAYASSVECEYGGYEQAFANTSADGTSRTYTVTVDKKTRAFKFSITGGSGGSYQGSAQGGIGGAGATVSGAVNVNEGDVITFIVAGGGGPYGSTASTPGRGWADGGSHVGAYIGTNSQVQRFQEHPGGLMEFYAPTGGGASAVLLNGTVIAIAGGGGAGGGRQTLYTDWREDSLGPRPADFKSLYFTPGTVANGGTGGSGDTNGGSYEEIYHYFPGLGLKMNGGLGGRDGRGGAGGAVGGTVNTRNITSVSYENNAEHSTINQYLAGSVGDDARLTGNGSNGGTGGSGVVGIGMVNTTNSSDEEVNQCSILHGATGGGGYGGGGSGSVTTSGGYITDQSWTRETYGPWTTRTWSPVGASAFSGGGGAGGSYVDSSQVYNSNISSGTTPGSPGRRVNGTAESSLCKLS